MFITLINRVLNSIDRSGSDTINYITDKVITS